MTKVKEPQMCRLVLCLNLRRNVTAEPLANIIRTLNAACVILYDSESDEVFLQTQAAPLISVIQGEGAAALIAEDSRIAGRIKADGIHMTGSIQELSATIKRLNAQMIIGFGEVKDRHSAMEAGEEAPDYLMFGKLGADKTESAHPRNLALGAWWAGMMEIPAIVQAGATLESVEEAAKTGAEFVAAEEAIFGMGDALQNAQKVAEILKKYPLNPEGGAR